MKNLFIGLLMLAGTTSFANSNHLAKITTTQNTKTHSKNVILTGCSYQVDGLTITVTCACTGAECRAKLKKILDLL